MTPFIGKIYPIPSHSYETFDYQFERYYKTHKGCFKTHQTSPYFYQDRSRGCVEKISTKEYLDIKNKLIFDYDSFGSSKQLSLF